ncbi:RagB/SusD family nutrient uptake outer membrane protein [Paraflavitalea sp. CAU 1676]|uniref:RagB/SusD family nutrient uptake outer membrane protein n=1 Tax=Paraflavitalea sp. CAU 1676 TaxID=3032598 RepID=UPI0023DB81DB|nr:RagB/SusD family nutrient uptake outer membrane protein [Paraflavitalea sp. CAU 1676]MDF2190535.1 RagB/SusD family nutrient uptake outer membrane protein [Paraflavitalea sp. CAU 1676]
MPPPNNELVTESMFASNSTANSAALGLYQKVSDLNISYDLTRILGLYSDELLLYNQSTNDIDLYRNDLQPDNPYAYSMWNSLYQMSYHANSLINGIKNSESLNANLKNQIIGESLFFRGLCHFWLFSLYGEIPLQISTDYTVNAKLNRSDSSSVISNIIQDLLESEKLVNESYVGKDGLTTTNEKGRVNKIVVKSLLSKVYLQIGNYEKAVEYSTQVINSGLFSTTSELTTFFLKNSNEAIFQITIEPNNTTDAINFVLTTTPTDVSLDTSFVKTFSPEDQRVQSWVGSLDVDDNRYYFPYKYKNASVTDPSTEYLTLLRISEQYLIRAEALAKNNKLEDAKIDLNKIRNRSGLPNTAAVTQETLVDSIYQEVKWETFGEWMNGWLALKRYSKFDAHMSEISAMKGGQWQPYKRVFPVPQREIDANRNLLPQNKEY